MTSKEFIFSEYVCGRLKGILNDGLEEKELSASIDRISSLCERYSKLKSEHSLLHNTQLVKEAKTKIGNIEINNVQDICTILGHNMYPVFKVDRERLSFGLNRCTRCGHEEKWEIKN